MLESNGSKPTKELFIHWVNEREAVRLKKEAGLPKPWSTDPVFQTTYFCNVNRENDRVTRWLRANWLVKDENYEFAMVLARLVNRPQTLRFIGYPYPNRSIQHIQFSILDASRVLKPFWGNAYVVTTHGQRMDKVQYLLGVLEGAHKALPIGGIPPTCAAYHGYLKRLEGFGDFMAAQVVADLKNTCFHPLALAEDWWSFVAPGPGSKRGMEWYFGKRVKFDEGIAEIQVDTMGHIPTLCNQDLQNCLCEFDKYMRVRTGTGRSKRKYAGA